tara:strand:+ start:238 stop:522 length:285 start_codon:yes stop_codon:yes gene_type:complete
MSKEVIPENTKYVRLRLRYPYCAFAEVDFGDIDLSQVESVKIGKWCNLLLTMKDGSVIVKETDIWDEASEPDWKYGFELCEFLDENLDELTASE